MTAYSKMLRGMGAVAVLASIVLAGHPAAAGTGETLGDLIGNMSRGGFRGMPGTFAVIAYILGVGLSMHAIFKFKDHVDNPHQTPVWDPVKRLLASGFFLSLPTVAAAIQGSMFGSGAGSIRANAVDGSGLTVDALDGMVFRFIADIHGPMTILLTAFSFVAGLALMLVGISRLTKKMEEGPRGPAGFGTIMTFIAAGALMSFGTTMGTFVQTIFGTRDLSIRASIGTDVITDIADVEKIESIVSGLLGFVMVVGFIAFIRGWFVLRSYADGQQGATLMQGFTFLIGGTLAINLGGLINAIQNTIGVSGLTFS